MDAGSGRRRLVWAATALIVFAVAMVSYLTADFRSGAFAVVEVIAVGYGVLLAFYLERVVEDRGVVQRQREAEATLTEIRRTLVGSVVEQWGLAKRYWFEHVEKAGDPKFPVETSISVAIWTAYGDDFLRLSPSSEDKLLFLKFFERLRRFQELAHARENLKLQAAAEQAAYRLVQAIRSPLQDVWMDLHTAAIAIVRLHGDAAAKATVGIASVQAATAPSPESR